MQAALSVVLAPLVQDSFAIRQLDENAMYDSEPLRLRYHTIYLVEEGGGTVQIDDGRYQLEGQQLVLIAQGQVVAFGAGAFINGYAISFGDCVWDRSPSSASNCKAVLFNNAEANQQLLIGLAAIGELRPLFEAIYEESKKPVYTNQLDALAAYLKIIMIKIANVNASLHKGFDDEEKQIYRRYIELVSAQYKTCHEVSAFADQLHVTSRKLTEICQRCSGKGAKQIINGQLIAEAKRSLLFSSSPVKEIAYTLNFATPEQFSHFFKKHAGISPYDYRSAYVITDR